MHKKEKRNGGERGRRVKKDKGGVKRDEEREREMKREGIRRDEKG